MQVLNKLIVAVKGMVRTMKCPVVWKPSLYMFLSLALSISTHEGQFYWYTNKEPPNPGFSQVNFLFMTCLMLFLTTRFATQNKGSLDSYHNFLAHQIDTLCIS
jgi:hypothetical protein